VAGFERLPVMVLEKEKDAKEYALIQLEENLQRKDLTPFEEAQAYERLSKEFGLQQKEIGELINKDKGYVSKVLRLTKIVKEIQQEMSEAEVSKNILWELAMFPEEQQKAIWEKIKHNPIEPVFQREVKQYQNRKQRRESSELFDADRVWEALTKVAQENKNALLDYIPKEKIRKLFKKVADR
jgi:ParB-like chromosome segregation protein Spo0J